MQKILILGLGAFGFAVAKHLGENNPDMAIYASEINTEIYNGISKTRSHPYFFEGAKLPENIELVGNTDMCSEERSACLQTLLKETDIIISVIPCQFVAGAFASMKDSLKDGVTILNLSKGIDNQSLQTVSEKLSEVLSVGDNCNRPLQYTYAYLAGGMIAAELVEGKILGADIVTENAQVGKDLQDLFQSESLDINLKIGVVKNTELYAALKNIIALILGYYEGTGAGASTQGYYFSKLLGEMQGVIELLSITQSGILSASSNFEIVEQSSRSLTYLSEEKGVTEIDFTDYALSGDLIATCFGGSRNRLLGNMLGQGKSIEEALAELAEQKKIAEGFETLKGVYPLTKGKEGFEEINKLGEKYLTN